jgi:RNA recognition motif-containing protein
MSDEEIKVFVGGLSFSTDERALEDAFSRCGEVTDVKVRYFPLSSARCFTTALSTT